MIYKRIILKGILLIFLSTLIFSIPPTIYVLIKMNIYALQNPELSKNAIMNYGDFLSKDGLNIHTIYTVLTDVLIYFSSGYYVARKALTHKLRNVFVCFIIVTMISLISIVLSKTPDSFTIFEVIENFVILYAFGYLGAKHYIKKNNKKRKI